jgi:Transposase DDE domain
MFLRHKIRRKDGKEHRYWSIVENRRVTGGRTVQRHVLYLGEINDSQRASWCQTIEALDEGGGQARQVALFPEDRAAPALDCDVVHVRLSGLRLRRPRQWGACWLAYELWEQLRLDEFWSARLAPSREGTRWLNVLKTLVAYRLIDPGSEWRLHRQWFEQSAMSDLLGEDFGLVSKDKLYRCLDLLAHKAELFSFLQQRWKALFHAEFDVLLYDLTSTYFECNPPENSKRRFGYSRDKRPDCVQVVIALVVTPEGFPLAYEVMPGNTADKTTLRDFIRQIETQYGKLRRTWVMDRGIPTEAVLAEMRQSATPMCYLVGTPRGRLSQMERQFLDKPWTEVRETLQVKLVEQDGELYVLARSDARRDKEQAMRRRRLKKLVKRLHELRQQKLTRDQLLIKLGAAKKEAGPAIYRIIDIQLPGKDQPVTPESFSFRLNWQRLREARRREGSYLLRSNMTGTDAGQLWTFYLQLVEVEQAFKELKSDLAIRPVYHQTDARIEAHIFVAFIAYCLQVTLKQRLRSLAAGLTPRSMLEKMAAIQMVDVYLPTTDGRTVVLSRYTEPEADQSVLLQQLKMHLPAQPPPRITATEVPRSA